MVFIGCTYYCYPYISVAEDEIFGMWSMGGKIALVSVWASNLTGTVAGRQLKEDDLCNEWTLSDISSSQ